MNARNSPDVLHRERPGGMESSSQKAARDTAFAARFYSRITGVTLTMINVGGAAGRGWPMRCCAR